jgi:tryptophanyl-tRNA synthetase
MNTFINHRIVSGITPSGDGSLHIGNYLGAVKQFIEIAKSNECFLFVADLHALTTIQNKAQLQKNVETLILNELALLSGFLPKTDFERIIFFRQSDIGLHPELQTIINNVTPLGLLKRAHAYKDKLAKDVMEDEINLGLFNYPVLMAADILIYKPDLVPVGKDQKQHIEITRDIADKFNKIYKTKTFKLPDGYIPEEVATILGTDGKRKMSKSLGNIISIFESPEVIKKQVNSCFTDPTRAHADDPGHVEGNMVFSYLDFFGDRKTVDEYKEAYRQGKVADMEIKEYLFKSLMDTFASARKRYEELKNNPNEVKEILERGRDRAFTVASQTMQEVRDAIGLKNKYTIATSATKTIAAMHEQAEGIITIDEFAKVEIRVGHVEKAENVEKSEKLILLTVNFGEGGIRTIYTGVRGYGYTPEDFSGKRFMFVYNLQPRKMPGGESQGMILAVDGLELGFGEHGGAKPIFISAEGLPVGTKVR